ncbi:MAG TPA: hypothetical protein VFA45_07880 [Actinomycetes bacterium]|nr:hypothetical protein [Actinomycetes bacterium]
MNDFNPGIDESGLFWTVAIPDDSVDVHPGAGTARLALSDFDTRDFHTLGNAIMGGASDPAVVSFDMRWSGAGQRVAQTDGSTFSFDSVINSATIAWSAKNLTTGMRFQSDPASTSETEFAAVGHEKNGVFFG